MFDIFKLLLKTHPLKSHQCILKHNWTFQPNLKKFFQGVPKINMQNSEVHTVHITTMSISNDYSCFEAGQGHRKCLDGQTVLLVNEQMNK